MRIPIALLSAVAIVFAGACADQTTEPVGLLEADGLVAAERTTEVGRVNGGGQLRDGEYKVSFGGFVEPTGANLTVQFHRVSDPAIAGGVFKGRELTQAPVFWIGDDPSCEWAVTAYVSGTFNGEPGYRVIYRAGDAGKVKGKAGVDTARFELWYDGFRVYDTHAGDFTDESSCVGTARTGLDAGNIMIK